MSLKNTSLLLSALLLGSITMASAVSDKEKEKGPYIPRTYGEQLQELMAGEDDSVSEAYVPENVKPVVKPKTTATQTKEDLEAIDAAEDFKKIEYDSILGGRSGQPDNKRELVERIQKEGGTDKPGGPSALDFMIHEGLPLD
jgi:hypothetical protein